MRKVACGTLLVALLVFWLPGTSAQAVPCSMHTCEYSAHGGSYSDSYWLQLRGHGVSASPGRQDDSHAWTEWDYQSTRACGDACTYRGVLYDEAAAECEPGRSSYIVASRQVGGQWGLYSTPQCLAPDELLPYDPAQLQAFVDDYFQRLPLPEPVLNLAPADNAVVNLPEIVSTTTPAQTTFTVTQDPFPTVTINAKVSWEWDFGDGTTLSTDTPGRPFDGADTDPANYLTHTYTKSSKGWPLSVTSVWTATYTIDGANPQPVNGVVRRTTTRNLPAADYAGTITGD